MSVQVEFLPGPLTSDMPRTAAEGALRQHPAIRKGAAYALEQLEGRWVAAVVHEAAPPPFPPNGGGPDEEEASPAPKSEGIPGGDESPGDGDTDTDDISPDGGDSEPPKADGGESKEKGKGGLEHQIMDLLTQIATALGLPLGLGDSGVPGADEGLGGPPGGPEGPPGGPGPPPVPGGPPHGPGDASTQHVIHQRVTKPGETPPGGTPIGAPAFASVREDHPWAHLAGKVASFEVSDKIGDTGLKNVQDELKALASEVGYRVARFREDRDDAGDRVAVAVITRH